MTKKKATKKPSTKKGKKKTSAVKKKTVKKTAVKKQPAADIFPYGIRKHDDLAWQIEKFKKIAKKMSDEDASGVLGAFEFAKKRHEHLKRVSGTPYIIHPVRMAIIMAVEWGRMDAVLISAVLLHDVVEDTQTTIREVKEAFGNDVGKLVDGMTMWKGSETPEVYLKRVARGAEDLRLIKCADTLDNLRSWHVCSEEVHDKFPRWWRQTHDYVLPMAHRTLKKAEQQIREIIEDKWYLEKAGMV